jgi:hypothetical protein
MVCKNFGHAEARASPRRQQYTSHGTRLRHANIVTPVNS